MAEEKNIIRNISISTGSIIKVVLVFLALYFCFLIRDILAILFVSLILASAFDPWVDFMSYKKIPRGVGLLLIYLVMFGILAFALYLLVPPIVTQISEISNSFPTYYEKVTTGFSSIKTYSLEHGLITSESFSNFFKTAAPSAEGFINWLFNIFGGIISFFVILVITFYLTVEETAIKRCLRFVAPDKYQPFLFQLMNKIQKKIGSWLQGQLILCLIIGVMSYIGLLILGVKYALILALVAAISELIPYVGPVIGAIPAVFLAFAQSPVKAILVIALYFVVQQLENHILVPKVMQKAVGLNPIISISSLLIGAKIGGVPGALLAIPVATAIGIIVREFFRERKEREEEILAKETKKEENEIPPEGKEEI